MRIRSVVPLLLLIGAFVVVPGPLPAVAGVAGDYPEFPYAESAYDEPLRGQFHFSARSGWMNDVNAPLYYDGRYHLFFQHNPHGLQWDTMHWGHATSPDLVHWTQKPIALEPGVHPGDLFSGGGVVDIHNTSGLRTGSDAPIVLFTGTNGVSIAYSNDGARTFQSYDGGRKVFTMPANSRDPKVFWHPPSQRWVMVVWSDAGGNAAHLYTSPNLLDWTWRSRFAADWLFECPDLFPLKVDGSGATRWVLNDAAGNYVVGSFDGSQFTADTTTPRRMDHGVAGFTGSYYAGLTFQNLPDERTVQLAWMPGNQGSSWTGSTTVPVDLALRTGPDGLRVTRAPVAELATLRTDPRTWTDRMTGPGADTVAGATSGSYEVIAEFDSAAATATRFGFQLYARPDGGFGRAVTFDRGTRTLNGVPLTPVAGRVHMRILVDRGQLEVFAGDGQVSITEANAASSTGSGVRVFAEGGAVRLVSLQINTLRSAWGRGEATLQTNLPGDFTAIDGRWTDVAGGKRGDAAGDAFYLNGSTARDLSYEADVRLESAAAAALTVRASPDGAGHYSANVDAAGLVKLWRPGRVIAVHRTPIARGRTYHLKLVAVGDRLTVFLDHAPTPVIDARDDTYTEGRLGFNVFAGAAVVQNANLGAAGFRTDLGVGWRPVAGDWTVTDAGMSGRGAGDCFYLSDRTGRDFRYAADVRVQNGRAVALTFRSTPDASGHYTATIDTDGVVKLWRPGRDLATAAVPIVAGRTYRLTVVAVGPRISIHLDDGRNPVIDVVDHTYAEGYFGLNVFDAGGVVQNVTVT